MFNGENWQVLEEIKGTRTKFIEEFNLTSLKNKQVSICEALQELLNNIDNLLALLESEEIKESLRLKRDKIKDCLIINEYYDVEKWFINLSEFFSTSYKEYHFDLLFCFLKELNIKYYQALKRRQKDAIVLEKMRIAFNNCLTKLGISLLYPDELSKMIFCEDGFSFDALPKETVQVDDTNSLPNDIEIDCLPYMIYFPNILYGYQVGYFSAIIFPGKISYNQKYYYQLLDQVYMERKRKKEV